MHTSKGTILAGTLLIIFGALFLLDKAGAIDFHFWHFLGDFWPVILIILGIWIIYEESAHKGSWGDISKSRKTFGDIDASPVEFTPKGLNYFLSFGQIRVNLGSTRLSSGENILKASTSFGEIQIFVPENIPCRVIASCGVGDIAIFGKKSGGLSSREDHIDPEYKDAETKLNITARAGFGSVKVKRT